MGHVGERRDWSLKLFRESGNGLEKRSDVLFLPKNEPLACFPSSLSVLPLVDGKERLVRLGIGDQEDCGPPISPTGDRPSIEDVISVVLGDGKIRPYHCVNIRSVRNFAFCVPTYLLTVAARAGCLQFPEGQ